MSDLLRTYRARCVLLCLGGLVVLMLLWKKRLSGSLAQWQERGRSRERLAEAAPLNAEIATVHAEQAALDASLGDLDRPADAVWRAVLSGFTEPIHEPDVVLSGVEAEHRSEAGSNTLILLPITLKGPFGGLLRTAAAVQRNIPEAHAISIRFHLEHGMIGKPPELLMTLYLQKITRHA